MAERPQLSAEPRTIRGKQVSRLRKQGIAPGVVYGPPLDVPRPISVETQALERIFYAHGTSALLDLSIDGVSYPVFIRSLQREPIRHQVLSVEFYAPPMNQAVVGTVPILATGELSSRVDGILTHTRESVDVRGLPDQIPTHFEV
ncbi:MAG TPA: hypothetical protein VFX74_05025, partial [Candidatus Limnocylindria bacterium]|nr:hypothetical protein [Candidatus Limnocylindria bacterium]